MSADLGEILKIEVPVVVRLGERKLRLSEVLDLAPGSIVELPQRAEDELSILINNREIGLGHAVKIGENFGVRVTFVGDVAARLEALGGGSLELGAEEAPEDDDAEALAEMFLQGQI